MTPEKRIKELITRQRYDDSSMVIKLRKESEIFHYDIWAWLDQGKTDNQFLVITGKYENQDPLNLIQMALKELGLKKIKLGVPIL